MGDTVGRVGVLDKSIAILNHLEAGPSSLAELVQGTGISRATAHRLAVALEDHGLVRRRPDGKYALGIRLVALGQAAAGSLPLAEAARPALETLRDETGESVQLYVRDGAARVCVAALESPHGLRTIVRLGAVLPLDAGSAGEILSASGVLDVRTGAVTGAGNGPPPDGVPAWVASVGQREAGVASVSAAVRQADGTTVAAVSVSGPVERTSPDPGARYGDAVVRAARRIETELAAG